MKTSRHGSGNFVTLWKEEVFHFLGHNKFLATSHSTPIHSCSAREICKAFGPDQRRYNLVSIAAHQNRDAVHDKSPKAAVPNVHAWCWSIHKLPFIVSRKALLKIKSVYRDHRTLSRWANCFPCVWQWARHSRWFAWMVSHAFVVHGIRSKFQDWQLGQGQQLLQQRIQIDVES